MTESGYLLTKEDQDRIQHENATLKAELERVRASQEDLRLRLQDRNEVFDELLNSFWQLLYPEKTDWEYPGQVFNHIRVEIERLRRQLARIDRSCVYALKEQHKTTWRDMPESYWLARLLEEFGELGASLANDHEHPPEWELRQIAAICLNWLEMRTEKGKPE